MEIKLSNLEETEEFGIKLGSLLKGGDIICLNGDLGAGKTTLTKSIGRGLGVDEYITSPTFALINEYKGKFPVYHFDVYRLENAHELYDLGFDEYFYGKGVCIIEWADKIEKMIPDIRIVIDIEKGNDDNERILHISGNGGSYDELIKELNR
ncbi:tRNA (adenosine(37)-N6)-threonylcarbamoyltransferase complex ATPase subunit type 1 TsaE [Paratissierella segnis]|uniref:tRNA threonylcarbamoyladenosine biosynthesis protein TsaE n=1 Tax=Paratissierella segnis TaxID=2763679 RepID=A0A926IKJ5_9FIRM|nr:tRNA (adenosine(37)-N6)-threonylcarbamoyltransferase complex ATPase subunit type 1 TsaE [Paratissierella segnis]MBC8589139.1 tRNA (adenosine(37)-N6)-threonylcarbamoyltransferase complex ATPase subunit type 1 TsaE [Paratissierella segnis]